MATPGKHATAKSIAPGPTPGTHFTEQYARLVARDTYFWAWTLSNVYNRRKLFATFPEPGKLGGVLPASPPNRITMLQDYIKPEQREVCCPNQDVVYDAGPLALPGEEIRYAEALALLDAAAKDAKLKAAIIDEATRAQEDLVEPLLQFRNYGIPLPDNWTTVNNGAQFGTDYFTRTAVARSNIFVNKPNEAKYFYQDLDSSGNRLNGRNRYEVTFGKDQPPVKGFWSITLYDGQHFFSPNEINRYSIGTKNKDKKLNTDGSVTIYVQAEAPAERTNWLPTPKGADFSLYLRTYWPDQPVLGGTWAPPPVVKATQKN